MERGTVPEAGDGQKGEQTAMPDNSRSSFLNDRRRFAALALIAGCCAYPSSSGAVEGGQSIWLHGITGFGAAVVPAQGVYYTNVTWASDVSINQEITLGRQRVESLDIKATANISMPIFTHDIEALGARFRALAAIPFVGLDGRFQVRGASNEHDNKLGLGDVIIEPFAFGWHEDDLFGAEGLDLHYMPGFLVFIPVGQYQRNETLNPGKNRWGFQPFLSWTLLHQQTGLEASQRLMYTSYLKNSKTQYESGSEFHFDYAIGKHFDNGLTAGIFGYFVTQVSGDSGQGATLGDFQGRSWGIGPMIQYSRLVYGLPFSVAARYQKTMLHRNRVDDDSLWLQATIGYNF